jgi:hypothetical protein
MEDAGNTLLRQAKSSTIFWGKDRDIVTPSSGKLGISNYAVFLRI